MKCRLKEILNERGMKHKYLSDKVDISDATASALINSRRLPTLPVAYRIAKLLELKIEDIWYEDDM